jgi:WD40 repeat protein
MPLQFQRASQFQIEQLSDWDFTSEFDFKQKPCCLTFEPQTSHLFIGDAGGNLYCHDVRTGAKLATFRWHKNPVVAVGCFQNSLYSFDILQNLVSWNLNTLQVDRVYSLTIHGGMPLFINTERVRESCKKYKPGDLVDVSWVRHSTDGNATQMTRKIPLWTVASAKFTHSGKYLIFGVNNYPEPFPRRAFQKLYTIDVETSSLVREFDWATFFGFQDCWEIDGFAISRDDTQLAASGLHIIYSSEGDWSNCQELIHQWCINDGAEICVYKYNDFLYGPSNHKIIDLAFSPNMNQLLIYREGFLSLWNVPSPESRRLIVDENDCSHSEFLYLRGVFDWSPVSNLVAFGSPEGILRFVDIDTTEILFEQQVDRSAIQQVHFSQNGEFLAVYSKDLVFEIWYIL